jgi:acetyl esterase/lipase
MEWKPISEEQLRAVAGKAFEPDLERTGMTACKRFGNALIVLTGSLGLIFDGKRSLAEDSPFPKKTVTYKTVGRTNIQADVYRSDDEKARPVLVWIHGGALIVGSRESVPKPLRDLCQSKRYVLVSLDYRLAPEVKLPDIVGDIEDAFTWLHKEGPKLFKADTDKLVVAGGSAGGYLTLLAGTRVKPRPKALIA